MQKYSQKAYAKINLSLNVLGKRRDGYHEVSMVMHQITLADIISLSRCSGAGIILTSDSKQIPLDERNIAYQAAQIMQKEFNLSDGVKIHIKKDIPIAGGLAGGSTDAAAVLCLMNTAYSLGLSRIQLMKLGLRLGADVPYCIFSKPALAEGIGESLTEIEGLAPCKIIIVNPCVEISTKTVYEAMDSCADTAPAQNKALINALRNGDNGNAFSYMKNAMEQVSIGLCPQIAEIIDTLMSAGAQHAMMSGSGATCFGIFSKNSDLTEIHKLFPGYIVRECEPYYGE